MKALINGKIIVGHEILDGYSIVYDKKIIEITKKLPKGIEEIDAKGLLISPGFINIHVHGAMGADVMDASEEAIETISKSLMTSGVTSYLATTMTMSKEAIMNAMDNVKKYMSINTSGAKVLGVHVEGPFINASYKGAQNENDIIGPEAALIEPFADIIKLITVAPEIKGMMAFVNHIKDKYPHIKFSIGHSAASYEEAINAYDHGIDSTTHLFNAMTGLHHRKPGIVGAVLKKKPYFELIADKIHCHSALFDIVGDTVGLEKMILVTDAMCACQMPQGEYALGGQKVIVDEYSARLENGALAGSILKMEDAIQNVKTNTNYSVNDVIKMATENPSTMLGLESLGRIEVGYCADFAIFDQDMKVKMTIIDGQMRYRKD